MKEKESEERESVSDVWWDDIITHAEAHTIAPRRPRLNPPTSGGCGNPGIPSAAWGQHSPARARVGYRRHWWGEKYWRIESEFLRRRVCLALGLGGDQRRRGREFQPPLVLLYKAKSLASVCVPQLTAACFSVSFWDVSDSEDGSRALLHALIHIMIQWSYRDWIGPRKIITKLMW